MLAATVILALAPGSPDAVDAFEPISVEVAGASRDAVEILALDCHDHPDAVIDLAEAPDGVLYVDVTFADGAWVSPRASSRSLRPFVSARHISRG